MKRLLILALLALPAAACSPPADDMGVVARVNGEPIALSQLEFQHDLLHMDGAGTYVPSVESLREEYGRILADLVVLELVEQELALRGLSVTDDEMAAEERRVRADYPGGAFEQVLVEEYIDLASWRRQLRYDMSRRKFFRSVLRPQVKVDYLEADAYYKKHLKDYRLPESYRLVSIRGTMRKDVEQALAVYRESGDIELVRSEVPEATLNELTVTSGQLSEVWKDTLAVLPEGEAGPVLETRGGFETLVLLKKNEAKLLNPTQAYPLVEEALLERKMAEAFEQWLAGQLAVAEIEISHHLLRPAAQQEQPAAANETTARPEQDGAPLDDHGEGEPLEEGDGMPLGEEDDMIIEETDAPEGEEQQ